MFFEYNHSLIKKARELRKNMTMEERKLWYDFLRRYPVRFLNQRVVDGYILDFYCSKARLCVETDGYDEIKHRFEEVCKKIDHKVKELLSKKQGFPNNCLS